MRKLLDFDLSIGSATPEAWVTALLGALVGGAFTLIGVWWQQMHERQRRRDEGREAVNGFLKAVDTEMATLWAAYMSNAGDLIGATGDDEDFQMIWEAKVDYFVIYRTNAHLLGQIRDDDVRVAIVRAYTTAMGMLESYATYSSLIRTAQAGDAATRPGTVKADNWALARESFPKLKAHHHLATQLVQTMREKIASELGTKR